jgi:GNAT superfamily N-acetyltransferase
MLTIRPATRNDAAEIARVHIASWRTTYAGIVPGEYLAALDEAERELGWREWLTRDILTCVAEFDGKIVGFISGGALREPIETYDGELYAIYLLQSAQGQGIGRQLLQELAGALLGKGFQSMAVWVLEQIPRPASTRGPALSRLPRKISKSAAQPCSRSPTVGPA